MNDENKKEKERTPTFLEKFYKSWVKNEAEKADPKTRKKAHDAYEHLKNS